MYKRKKAKWLTCYNTVDGVVEKPIEFSESDVKLRPGFKFEDASLEDLKLKAMANSKKKLIGYRVLAVLSLLFCLMVLITEATVIANPEKTLVYLVMTIDDFTILLDSEGQPSEHFRCRFVHYILLGGSCASLLLHYL